MGGVSSASIPVASSRAQSLRDAHAFLVAVYKNPKLDHHTRQDAAKAALPYEKPRLQAVKLANQGAEPLKVRSELEIGRRLAFVLELIARGEVKAKMPEGRASIGWSQGPRA